MKKTCILGIVLVGLLGASLAGCGVKEGMAMEEVKQGNQVMGVSVHDPSIVKANDKYYIFGTHMSAAVSENLQSFKSFANGVNAGYRLFDNLFTEDMQAFSYVGKFGNDYAVWAPDVMYNPVMKKWVMYFCTSHDYRTSDICMATADAVEGPYHFQDILLYSGFNTLTVEKTNFYEIMGENAEVKDYLLSGQYNNFHYPNCIDPAVFYDEDGKLWMVYGSWSGGIFLLELDERTGYPIHPQADEDQGIDTYFGRHILAGNHNSCEGPYILYDEESGYYYLFVSYGELTREGGYQIRQYRSDKVTGPYVDAAGNTLGYDTDHSQFGLKMMGNYNLPSLKTAYMAPGHNSALKDDDGRYYLVHHQRFDSGSEYHEPRVHQMFVNEDGWLVAAPFATVGEKITDAVYQKNEDISGVYYYLNHGTDISGLIHDTAKMELKKNGTVVLEDGTKGTFHLSEEGNFVTVTLENVEYKGVVLQMTDEAGNLVRCITASGSNNETIWAVLYIQ